MSTKIFKNFLYKNNYYQKKFLGLFPHCLLQKNILFTKSGDAGKSSINEQKIFKDHVVFEAIGTTEELCSLIGVVKEFVREDQKLVPLEEKLQKIQLVLIDIVDIINSLQPLDSLIDKSVSANPPTTAKVTAQDINELESLMTYYGTLLPPPESKIIPGGGKASALLHLTTAVCRRCERVLVSVFKDMENEKKILVYINRLSSYLCQAARICAKFSNRAETVYKPQLKGKTTVDK